MGRRACVRGEGGTAASGADARDMAWRGCEGRTGRRLEDLGAGVDGAVFYRELFYVGFGVFFGADPTGGTDIFKRRGT